MGWGWGYVLYKYPLLSPPPPPPLKKNRSHCFVLFRFERLYYIRPPSLQLG